MKGQILRVAVPSPLRRCFDYLPPPGVGMLRPGIRLRVPFGHTRQVGVLLELPEDSPLAEADLRPALEVLDPAPLLPEELLELARWAIGYYHHPPGEVLATLLPVLLRQGHPASPARCSWWRATGAGLTALAEGSALDRAPRQRELLTILAAAPQGLAAEVLSRDHPSSGAPLRALGDRGWVERVEQEVAPLQPPPLTPPPRSLTLNPAQSAAVAAVSGHLEAFQPFLLNGVTGSGKTEVYLSLVEQVLQQGRQALLLVPEIGLTPQLLERVRSRLAVPLAVMHSGLSDRERLSAWLAARDGRTPVVIGTRSAVFAPLPDLGLIVVDEEHDGSFKQQEGFRYHARDLAVVRARRLNIPVVLGSATPSLESLYNVRRGRYRELSLPARVGTALQPTPELIDLRRQQLQEGLSQLLLERINEHLARGEQVLLFLNRRGFAPTLICHECGWLGNCRHCDARLTLHRGRRRLICHHCGYQQPLRAACPQCGSVDLRALGAGTERLEAILKRAFPGERIARIDRDSTRRKGSLDSLLDQIHRGQRRILLGTQMLAKGHHFPEVTLVGIVAADQGLFGSDFR
ncbi:MAG: primosomal protein N', partial [Candidatus Competibacteraceae bacterium]|nr:primosomal protein N' [Candidatus Competibacteraceae bacterium]